MKKKKSVKNFPNLKNKTKTQKMDTCPICLDYFSDPIVTNCNHKFCSKCIKKWSRKKTTCPICRNELSSKTDHILTELAYFIVFSSLIIFVRLLIFALYFIVFSSRVITTFVHVLIFALFTPLRITNPNFIEHLNA